MDTLSLTKEARIYGGEKTISLTSGAGKTGQPLVKEPDLPLEKPICRPGSTSQNWTWNNRLVPHTSRLYIVTLLI